MNTYTLHEAFRTAEHPDTSPETLRVLAAHEYWTIRYEVAYNPNTPADALRALTGDEDRSVREGAMSNPNCST